MKNHLSDRRWIIFILVLLAVEIVWLLSDLKWIHLPFLNKSENRLGSVEAGYVLKSKEDLKRRGANSLIWEPTKEKDILYFKDAVLTLSQSTARLLLKNETELQLSENTLVTIEENEDKLSSGIRLRFSKGDIRTRNPHSKTQIVGEDWLVNVERGSEIALRKDKGSYEFEVLNGKANLETKAGNQVLDQQRIFKLDSTQQVVPITKNPDLKWQQNKSVRIYTLDGEASIPLEWLGNAEELSIKKLGDEEIRKSNLSKQQDALVKFKEGTYKLRLMGKDGVSETKDVEIWKAPRIFLNKPLARDRLDAGKPIEFAWTNVAHIKEYRIYFYDSNFKQVKSEIVTEKNVKSFQFDQDQDLHWKVEAVDHDGFLIPAFYQLPIFIRDEPLEAPKLKPPSLRPIAPENPDMGKTSFLRWPLIQTFLLQKARAAGKDSKNYEILFEWDPVNGADSYVIEVSAQPDFHKTELIKNLKTTSFRWDKAKHKKYYWRVAAGNSRGKLGFFSQAMEIKLEDLKIVESNPVTVQKVELVKDEVKKDEVKKEEVKVVEVSKVEEIEINPPIEKTEAVIPNVNPIPEIKVLPKVPWNWGVVWTPTYKFLVHEVDAETKLKLNGGQLNAFQISLAVPIFIENSLRVSFRHSSQEWEPTPASDYSQQKSLTLSDSWLHLDYAKENHNHRYGFVMHAAYLPMRTSPQTITVINTNNFGLRYSYLWPLHMQQLEAGALVAYSSKIQEVGAEIEYRRYIMGNPFKIYVGTAGKILYQKFTVGSGHQQNLYFLFGFDSF